MQSRAMIFIGLNAVRFLSLVGLILTFASSIVVLVSDIHAIQRAGQPQVLDTNSTESEFVDCDYLECVIAARKSKLFACTDQILSLQGLDRPEPGCWRVLGHRQPLPHHL